MAGEGVTVIVTTHYLDEAEHCSRIALMHAGRLVALGSVRELKEVFAGRAVLEIRAPRFLDAFRSLEGESWALETSVFGTRLHVVVEDAEEGRRRVLERPRARRERPGGRRADRAVARGRVHPLHRARGRRGRGRRPPMRKIWAVALKELRQASRDPLSLLLLLGMPTAMLLLYGYARELRRAARPPRAVRTGTGAPRAAI